MENRAHALIAGVFVFVMGLALIATLSWFQGDRVARAHFTVVSNGTVTGLNAKAPVKLRGVDIGKVDSIGFDPADPHRILVGILVDEAAPLTHGTYAQLAFQGVTGLQFIALSEDGHDARPLRDPTGRTEPRIELRPTLLDDLASAAPSLVKGARESVDRVNAVLSDTNRAEIDRSLAALATTLQQLAQVLAELRPAATALPALVRHSDGAAQGAAQLVARADSTLDKLDGAIGGLNGALGTVSHLAEDADRLTGDLRGRAAVLDQLGVTARQLEITASHVESALTQADPTTAPPLIDQVSRLTGRLQHTVDDLSAQPQSLLFGRAPEAAGPGEHGFAEQLEHRP